MENNIFEKYSKENEKIHVGSRDIANIILNSTNLYALIIKRFLNIKPSANNSMNIGLILEDLVKKYCILNFSAFKGRSCCRSSMFKKMAHKSCTVMAQADMFYLDEKKRVICEIKCRSQYSYGEIMSSADFIQMMLQYLLGNCTNFYYLKVMGAYDKNVDELKLTLYELNKDITKIQDVLKKALFTISEMLIQMYKHITAGKYLYTVIYETDARLICDKIFGEKFSNSISSNFFPKLTEIRYELEEYYKKPEEFFVKKEELIIDKKELFSNIQ